MYFDISGVANKANKRFSRYVERDEFKEYLKMCSNVHNLNETELIKKSGHQVKIHKVLLVDFARWINIEFAVFADKIIMDILLGNKHLCEAKVETLENELKKEKSKKDGSFTFNNRVTMESIRKEYGYKASLSELFAAMKEHNIIEFKKVFHNEWHSLVPYAERKDGRLLFHEDTIVQTLDELGYERESGHLDSNPRFDFD